LLVSGVLRAVLIAYGEWHDGHLPVPYTDIDYGVYGDAARLVSDGRSPYDRPTYRYSPVLSWILTLNVVTPVAGKLLFASADLVLATLVSDCLRLRGVPETDRIIAAAVVLVNPLSMTVSTRGNADVLIAVTCVAMIHALLMRRTTAAGLCFGCAVHLKLYPIVYAPALLAFINDDYATDARSTSQTAVARCWQRLSWHRLLFAVSSGCTFLMLSCVCWWLYGARFVHETYIFHLTRADTRHNFSLYFYHLYLTASAPSLNSALSPLLAFLPQVTAVTLT
jgi:GPI mannosyltransferase 1 subunit M